MSSGHYDNHFPTAIQALGVNNILPMTDSPSRSPYTIYDVERASTSFAAGTDVVDEKGPMFLKERIISEDDIRDLKQINDLLKTMRAHTSDASQEKANTALRVRIAIHASFIANCCLAVLQLYAAISSGSLALFARCVDAVDPLANMLLWITYRASNRVEKKKWPIGGSRFQSVRKSSSQVDVLWEDHRNELCTNAFGILTSAGGAKLKWWSIL
ncbi:cation diffusion facilitator [Cryptococcus deuterogattii MMRL2647]|nr:cation diffusion facilitator [Cryptococcus deuterogattii MMRL2647]